MTHFINQIKIEEVLAFQFISNKALERFWHAKKYFDLKMENISNGLTTSLDLLFSSNG